MHRKVKTIDGFVPRYQGRSVGRAAETSLGDERIAAKHDVAGENAQLVQSASQPLVSQVVSTRDISDSLKDIDDEEHPKRKRRFWQRKSRRPMSRKRKIIGWIIRIIILLALVIGAYVGIKAFIASSQIFKGNFFGIFQNKPLKMDANGRTNILVLGSTDDDPNHPGNTLTDTIMVVSIDQNKKNGYVFSIPRDLWVNYNQACASGYQGKVNVYFYCSKEGDTPQAEQERLTKTQKFIGDILGLDIQYGVHVNSVVVRDAVNAVGGVDLDVRGSGGDPGVLDRNFDGQCNYTCYWVNYTNGVHHMDGAHAMYFSMARGSHAPTYGLSRGNFDREINQQKILIALKTKAVSAGTLTDVGKVTSLIDAMGKNLRTNFDTSEIRTLMSLGKDIPADSVKRLSLIEGDHALVTTGQVSGQSIVQPIAGLFDYSQIQAYVKKELNANDITREDAHVALFNGSGVDGYAKTQSDRLTEQGFTITSAANAPSGKYEAVEIYDLTRAKPATKAKLEKLYGVTSKTTKSPISVSVDTDFVVVYGKETSTGSQ